MKAVVYYSNTGQSAAIASLIAKNVGFPVTDMRSCKSKTFDELVIVFPIYCQDIPEKVTEFLSGVSFEKIAPIATYGRMSTGNALYKLKKIYGDKVIAAAYIPTKHSYLDTQAFDDFDKLRPLFDKLQNPSPVVVPPLRKNPLAGFFPKTRSRIGVKLRVSDKCDKCGVCTSQCRVSAMRDGAINNSKCIRCLACVYACPKGAITFKTNFFMRYYLRKPRVNELLIYV